ncbi:expressed unknown protein [Seminavis robusta]|uniref:Uncharacterized protein n=1 Tax=Seminavis robusta TaxID=568900 RepID=A0A9N8HM60_9STRA|nr:expressed unknown protein [Seminavis robusta]|eukprot:Sro870_g213690.1 n/a (320) ;mRNA; f:31112-32463
MTIAQRVFTSLYHHDKQGKAEGICPATVPRILAVSAINKNQQRIFELRDLDRKLCEDRKTPLEHLQPGSLAKSTFRIVVTQGSFVLSNYANDQLQQDIARDRLVAAGEMTQEEADEAAEEWEQREWKIRWETFPSKLTEALVKYHVIVLVMRLYEHIASTMVDKFTLDSYTLDTFKHSKRIDAKEKDNSIQVGRQMFSACWSANLIAFLADYSVHQVILGYGYYRYVQQRRKKRQLSEFATDSSSSANDNNDNDDDDQKPPIAKQSAVLVLSRTLGLTFTATGGAVGSMILPGWGTLLGSNFGDSLGGVVADATSAMVG